MAGVWSILARPPAGGRRSRWSASAAVDPIATARRLLAWRDALVFLGWDPESVTGAPRISSLAAVTREVSAIAPILPGAEEEHLNARLSAFDVKREHVRLVERVRIDALRCAYARQRPNAVAQPCGVFELKLLS